MGWISDVVDAVGDAASSAVDAVEDAAGAVAGVASDAAGAVVGAAEDVAGAVESFASDTFSVISSAAVAVGHGVEDVAKTVEKGVEDAADATGSFLKKAAKTVGHAVADAAKGVWEGVKDVAEGIGGGVLEFGKGLFVDGIGGFVSNLAKGDVKGAFNSLIRGADEAFIQAPGKVVNGVIDGVQDASDGLTHLLPDPIGSAARQVVDRTADGIRVGVNTAIELGRDAYRFLTETPVNFVSDVYDAGDKLVHGDFKGAAEQFGMAFANVGIHAGNTLVDMGARALQGAATVALIGVGAQPPSRKLTDAEKDMLREVYGDSVDLDSIRIYEGGPLVDAMAPHTVGNAIYMSKTIKDTAGNDVTLVNDDGSLTAEGLKTLAHETAHVWQSQNGGGEYIGQSLYNQEKAQIEGGDRGGAYDYKTAIAEGKSFDEMNPEEQAKYIENELYPLLTQPGDAEANINSSTKLSDAEKAYALDVLHHIQDGTGAA